MTFWTLIKSILLVCLCTHPIVLALVGVAQFIREGKIDGLFAVLATPMTLAFFGLPALAHALLVIVPSYYLLSYFGRRAMVPYAVFAVGAASLLYLIVVDPAPSGAMPGYDQTAQGFAGATLIVWAAYAFFRLDLRPS